MPSVLRIARGLLAMALVLGATAIPAANRLVFDRKQEAAVRAGMTATQVEQILGRPTQLHNYRGAAGPTWTYRTGPAYETTEFVVVFGADDKVVSARELWRPNGG